MGHQVIGPCSTTCTEMANSCIHSKPLECVSALVSSLCTQNDIHGAGTIKRYLTWNGPLKFSISSSRFMTLNSYILLSGATIHRLAQHYKSREIKQNVC